MGTNKVAALLGTVFLAATTAAGQSTSKPPAPPVRPVTDNYFGVEVTDPYRYMENLKSPDVAGWIQEEGRYTQEVLDSIPGHANLLAEVRSLDDSEPAKLGKVDELPGERFFYLKEAAGQSAFRLYERDGLDGKEKLLVDPLGYDEPGKPPHTISFFAPSYDGSSVVYGISEGGNEVSTIYVLDLASGKVLADKIPGVRVPFAAWLPDGTGFFYNRLEKLPAGAPAKEKLENSHVYLHKLGDGPAKDARVFGAGVVNGLTVTPGAIPTIDTAPQSKYVLAVLQRGVDETLEMYAAPLDEVGKADGHWIRVGDNNVSILDYTLRGDMIYLLAAGRMGPVVGEVSLVNPAIANWRVMLQLGPSAAISGMEAVTDAVYITMIEGGRESLVRIPYNPDADILRVKLPIDGSVHIYSSDPRTSGALVALSSWTQAPAIYRYDSQKDKAALTPLWPRGRYDDPKDIVATDATALGSDGALVPLTILMKKGTERDGTHPTLLIGYGSYSIALAPTFTPLWRAWLDRGGVLAFAHVRGGGEFGGFWRFEGMKVDLPNRYHDFLTCAEYLVNQGYTTPSGLAAMGGSAGAILVGRAITERPDLFRAAVIESGLLDLLRYEDSAVGAMNVPEFGSTKTLEGFEDLEAISSYNHVEKGVKYPAVMLEVGMDDPRVQPWQSAKMAARLQADSTSGYPVLLRVSRNQGHSLVTTARQRQTLYADELSFLLWQLGAPDFQPRPTVVRDVRNQSR